MKYLLTLFSFFVLAACGGSTTKELSPLLVKDDTYVAKWVSEAHIEITKNDRFPSDSEVILTKQPEHGNAEIRNGVLIYTAQNEAVTDVLQYQIRTSDGRSANAKVNIELVNWVTELSILEGENQTLIEGNSYEIKFKSKVPITAEVIEVKRYQDGALDEAYGSQSFDLQKNDESYSVYYRPSDLVSEYYGKRVEQSLVLSINPDSTLDDAEITYSLMNTPPAERVPSSFRATWYNASGARAIIDQQQFHLSWTSFPSWNLPNEPNWHENPYGNNTWLLYYHSLAWLHAYEYRFDINNNEALLQQVRRLINDYIATVGVEKNIAMTWNDHTVASRAGTLAYFYHKFFRNNLTSAEKETWLNYIYAHADKLSRYFTDKRFIGHNHGLIHAVTLYKISFIVPELHQIETLRADAKQRMHELFGEMVNVSTGASKEQSMHYQLVAIEMLSNVKRIELNLEGSFPEEIDENLRKMVNFTTHLIYVNGGGPAFGDSNYRASTYLSRLKNVVEKTEISTPYFVYLSSLGADGLELERQYVSTEDGYVTTRFIKKTGSGLEDQAYMLSNFGKKFFSHGHHDAMSFVFATRGESILIDAGGPYLYTSVGRRYFRSKYAHNTLVVNGEEGFSADAELLGQKCLEDLCVVYGRVIDKGIHHFRLQAMSYRDESPQVFVFDSTVVASNDEPSALTDFELLYHFPPLTKLGYSPENQCFEAQLEAGSHWCILLTSSHEQQVEIIEGLKTETDEQGWVQPKFGKKVPAPVYSIKSSGSADYFQLTSIISAERANNGGEVLVLNNGYTLKLNGYSIDIQNAESEQPQVTINAY